MQAHTFLLIRVEDSTGESLVCSGGDSPNSGVMFSKKEVIRVATQLSERFADSYSYTIIDITNPFQPLSYNCVATSNYKVIGLN